MSVETTTKRTPDQWGDILIPAYDYSRHQKYHAHPEWSSNYERCWAGDQTHPMDARYTSCDNLAMTQVGLCHRHYFELTGVHYAERTGQGNA